MMEATPLARSATPSDLTWAARRTLGAEATVAALKPLPAADDLPAGGILPFGAASTAAEPTPRSSEPSRRPLIGRDIFFSFRKRESALTDACTACELFPTEPHGIG